MNQRGGSRGPRSRLSDTRTSRARGSRRLVSPERASGTRRSLDPSRRARHRFRTWTADYFTDAPGNSIGDLTAAGRDVLLLIERDNLQGAEAATKRIYELEIDRLRGHAIPKTLLVDLLRIANPDLIGGPAQPGVVGLGDPFGFPFQTIESVLVADPRTLVVANDNNYPFSAGRRPGQPDDNELIQIRLPHRLLPVSQ